MASTQQIKRRIRSVKSTKQITKAMELVAASKMRRAQEAALRSRAYRNTAREILTRLAELTDISKHPLYTQREVKRSRYIVVTSDRGLAGAYNTNILKNLTTILMANKEKGVTSELLIIGRQGATFASKLEDAEVVGVYEKFPDQPAANDLQPILQAAKEDFEAEKIDAVVLLYTDFKSSIAQEVTEAVLLPASFVPTEKREDLSDSLFEPSPQRVLDTITPRLIEVQLLQAILESSASEHSMRMLAMKNASDNAGELIDDLTLEFNSARQAAITQELAEITGGVEAIS